MSQMVIMVLFNLLFGCFSYIQMWLRFIFTIK